MAKIANVALTNTFDAWRTRSNESFDRLSQFAINNSSLYANTLTSNVSFLAKGTATVTGLFTASGRATVGTNLSVSGNSSVTVNLTVNGATTLGDAATDLTTINGRATIAQNLNVSGNTTLGAANKTITTTGLISHTGRATISTNLAVTGNTTLNASGANGVFTNTASFGVFSNTVNYSNKKIRNFSEDAQSYRNSATAITLNTRNVQRITLTGNATVTLPSGMPGSTEAVKSIIVIFKQDGTGGRTMSFAAPAGETLSYNNSATLPAVASTANKITIYVCTKFDGDTTWYISQSFIQV